MPDKKADEKEVDYLHPDGVVETKPRTAQEKRNEAESEDLTELAEELVPDAAATDKRK